MLRLTTESSKERPAKKKKKGVMVRTYSFDSFSLPFNVLLSPRFATEAQNNSVSNPAGHSYSNVSNAPVQNNHSLLETVQITV